VECPLDFECEYGCWGPTEWTEPILCSKTKPQLVTEAKAPNCPGTPSSQLTGSQHFIIIHFTQGLVLISLCVIICLVFTRRTQHPHKQQAKPINKKNFENKPIFISAV